MCVCGGKESSSHLNAWPWTSLPSVTAPLRSARADATGTTLHLGCPGGSLWEDAPASLCSPRPSQEEACVRELPSKSQRGKCSSRRRLQCSEWPCGVSLRLPFALPQPERKLWEKQKRVSPAAPLWQPGRSFHEPGDTSSGAPGHLLFPSATDRLIQLSLLL